MGVDTSIYQNIRLPDFVGAYKEGKEWRQKQDDIEKLKQNDEMMASIYKLGPDGKMTIDQSALQGYAQKDPRGAYKLQQDQLNQQFRYDEMNQRALDRKEMGAERRFLAGIKMDEKMQGLKTPYGLANTEEDAKSLKSAHEAKANFDNKLNQMIALRQKHNGGAILNRDDIGVGKQLSKDLLLEYKNMAKLGVLSAADEAIINEIIPADPLEYNSPFAALSGQDPISAKLNTFKQNADKDFQTRVGTRTRAGVESGALKPNAPMDMPTSEGMSLMPKAHAEEMPKIGFVKTWKDGSKYIYKGGQPNNPQSWSKTK